MPSQPRLQCLKEAMNFIIIIEKAVMCGTPI